MELLATLLHSLAALNMFWRGKARSESNRIVKAAVVKVSNPEKLYVQNEVHQRGLLDEHCHCQCQNIGTLLPKQPVNCFAETFCVRIRES